MFRETVEERIPQLTTALETGDAKTSVLYSHELKGMSSHVNIPTNNLTLLFYIFHMFHEQNDHVHHEQTSWMSITKMYKSDTYTGSSANIGADALCNVTGKMEHLSRNDKLTEAAAYLPLLRTEFEETVKAFKIYLKEDWSSTWNVHPLYATRKRKKIQ